jgi:gamma-glutamyl hydrolase
MVRIGILSAPMPYVHHHPVLRVESYINREYLDWVQLSGAVAVVVPYNTAHLPAYLRSLHGMVFCGGSIENRETHTPRQYKAYLAAVHTVVDYAVRERDGGGYFPIWGTCLGFEILALMGDPPSDRNLFGELQKVEKFGKGTLTFAPEASRIKRRFPAALRAELERTPCCTHRHHYGFVLTNEHFAHMRDYLTVVATDRLKDGTPFLNMFEHKHYPFYGAQWHPERTFNAASEQVAEILSAFLRDEGAKAKKRAPLRLPHHDLNHAENVLIA